MIFTEAKYNIYRDLTINANLVLGYKSVHNRGNMEIREEVCANKETNLVLQLKWIIHV